jgi:hypothetical protein
MPLRSPNLDDRRFDDLVAEAKRLIGRSCPGWTDLSPGDPGMVLLEVFAHLTEVMIYRLNRLPEKAYVEFLRLIGVTLQPPAAACATLQFGLARPLDRPTVIARGTRVTAARAAPGQEAPVFVTLETVAIGAGALLAETSAYHCDLVEAELLGAGTGLPGLSLQVARPPVVAPTGGGLDLVVGVEAAAEEIAVQERAIQADGRAFQVWREVANFTDIGPDPYVYVADRLGGRITFAPAVRAAGPDGRLQEPAQALAAVPAAGRQIRAWYRRGGGAEGNVAANTLTVLKDPIPGLAVTNPAPASGGRAAETLENALMRGPQELHSLRRAVTARDFELTAVRASGGVDRARAFTRATLWVHAPPGTVEVLLVPRLPGELPTDRPVTVQDLQAQQAEPVRRQIGDALDQRKPLGTNCVVAWARCKPVRVAARLIVHREEDPAAVKARVLRRLYQTIDPLWRSPDAPGWPFGQALSVWHVYKLIGSEPGVQSVNRVRLWVDDAPDAKVVALEADAFQPRTWYAGCGDRLFRSMNDGAGWEFIRRFPGEEVVAVKAFPREAVAQVSRAGLVAFATRLPGPPESSRIYFSTDCGESWRQGPQTRFRVDDMAWLEREGGPALLLAAEGGLYELPWGEAAVPVPVLVDPQDPNLGFYSVAVSTDVWGQTSVAVAARGDRGVFLSSSGGRPGTFSPIGLETELVRVLTVQHRGPDRYLWAGVAAPGNAPGKGCFRWRLTGTAQSPEGWRPYQKNWAAGGCRSFAFSGSTVFAASFRGGVLKLDTDAREPEWKAPALDCGLPLRDTERLLHPVDAVVCDPGGRLLLAAGIGGVFRSDDQAQRFTNCSATEFTDEVTLPTTWLFCSAEHDIEVVSEDEAQRD